MGGVCSLTEEARSEGPTSAKLANVAVRVASACTTHGRQQLADRGLGPETWDFTASIRGRAVWGKTNLGCLFALLMIGVTY